MIVAFHRAWIIATRNPEPRQVADVSVGGGGKRGAIGKIPTVKVLGSTGAFDRGHIGKIRNNPKN